MNRPIACAGALAALLSCSAASASDPIKILFVGDSYTFGRVDPVESYNWQNVHDLTAAFNVANPSGSNTYEPHPWGGVPGIFKELTDESGLNYDVSISARNAASLRGQFLNTSPTTGTPWDMRGNVASQQWGVVVLQDLSDVSLPNGKGKNANNAQFNAYVGKWVDYIHNGAAEAYSESQLYGSTANCVAITGNKASTCDMIRNIPANTNASANTKVYLTETWARPDMVFAHKITTPDPNSPSGEPIVDTSSAGGNATTYYTSLGAMSADLHAAFAVAGATPGIAGVIPVGDAFQMAVNQGTVKTGNFYDANGVFIPPQPGEPLDLWWDDDLHASKYGSFLDALVQFGTITGLNPLSLGANEAAAAALGISPTDALFLETLAAEDLGMSIAAVPEPDNVALMGMGAALLAFLARRRRA
jgi:hypothetical protein